MSVKDNLSLASLDQHSAKGCLNLAQEEQQAEAIREQMDIRLHSVLQDVEHLSGGNQQKVVLGKWLKTQPRLLLLDEPTRGIDIHAKQAIYNLINQWTEQGVSIMLITSELPELLALADRILVMHRGEVTATFSREEANEEHILKAAMGVHQVEVETV